jgi:uncharacterized membrane protein
MSVGSLIVALLRVIHVFGAFAWIGGGMFLLSVVLPTVQAAGPEGGKFMQWVGRTGNLTRMFTAASLTTIVAGVLLYFPTSGNFNADWLRTGHGIVLTIGALIGLLAFFHGIFGAGAVARRSSALAREMASRNGPPAPEQIQQMQALGASSARQAAISVTLGSLALIFMTAAQNF